MPPLRPLSIDGASSKGSAPVRLVGIEIGGTKLQLAAGDSSGRILERVRFQVNRDAGAEGIRGQIKKGLPTLIERWHPKGIGIGYGGPVDWRTGRIIRSYHIEGWNGFGLAAWIKEQSGLPAFLENDANAAALGEALYGAGKGLDPVLWMNSGSGVGGGLVTEGRIYHGAPPGEMELGHLRLERSGTTTEDLCSGWSIDKLVRSAVEKEPEGALAKAVKELPDPGGEARALGIALAAKDASAENILGEVASSLAYALSHAVHLLHPEVVVLGGGVALLGEPLRSRIAANLPRWLMEPFAPGPTIRLAALMEDAVLVGALAVAANRLPQSLSSEDSLNSIFL